MKKLKVTVDGQVYEVEVEPLETPDTVAPPVAAIPVEAGEGEDVPSPLAGKVVEVKVALGDRVAEGETVVVLEAMKMNTLVSAQRAGEVVAIHVAAGDLVEESHALITIA